MPPVIAALPYILGAVAAVGAVGAYAQGNSAAKQQRRALDSQRRGEEARSQRERLDIIRRGRAAAGTAQNNAAVGGVSDSSGGLGGEGSIWSQMNSSLSFLDQQQQMWREGNSRLDNAQRHTQAANTWSSVSNLAMMGLSITSSLSKPAGAEKATVAAPSTPHQGGHSVSTNLNGKRY